jgi:DNA polymerase
LFQYFGAATGRWAGRKIQLQNLPRPKIKQEAIERAISAPEKITGNIMQTASDCIRGMFIPAPGNTFICADYSNIEGRCLAWIAGEEWKLRAFRAFDADVGDDLYRLAYAKSFRKNVDKVTDDERQIGKVMELALGYGGGVGAFQTMARGYGVKVTDAKAEELKTAWRDAHPKTKSFWYALEEAASSAITHPGQAFKANRIVYIKKGSFLCCKLPSGRIMYYPYPKLEMVDTPWGDKKMGITYMSQDSQSKKWMRCKTYGGSLCENICQAISRDILAEGMLRLESVKYKIVMHVHDEIVAEIPKEYMPEVELEAFESIMAVVPEWATGFPIVAKGWTGDRYRK